MYLLRRNSRGSLIPISKSEEQNLNSALKGLIINRMKLGKKLINICSGEAIINQSNTQKK
jgi:hypothetical protein